MEYVTVGMLRDMIKDAPDDMQLCIVNHNPRNWRDCLSVANVSQVAILHCHQESPNEAIALYAGSSSDDDITKSTSQVKEKLFDGH